MEGNSARSLCKRRRKPGAINITADDCIPGRHKTGIILAAGAGDTTLALSEMFVWTQGFFRYFAIPTGSHTQNKVQPA